MRQLIYIITALLLIFPAQAQEEKPEILLNLNYHALNNKVPYLMVSAKVRKDKVIETVKGATIKVFITEVADENLLASVVTDDKGIAKLTLPVSSKEKWASLPKHAFIALSEETPEYAETQTEIEITKTKILIDTTLDDEGKRAVSVQFMELSEEGWVPAADVELKIGVQRLGSLLPISEEETYTTDEEGMVVAAFERKDLPTIDEKGNIVLAVKVEDNDSYGNLVAESTVPWGTFLKTVDITEQRTLWGTRDKTPLWLLFIAYALALGVWSTIIYLVFQIIKIKKLGKAEPVVNKKPTRVPEPIA
jgi:hypothetical protein